MRKAMMMELLAAQQQAANLYKASAMWHQNQLAGLGAIGQNIIASQKHRTYKDDINEMEIGLKKYLGLDKSDK